MDEVPLSPTAVPAPSGASPRSGSQTPQSRLADASKEQLLALLKKQQQLAARHKVEKEELSKTVSRLEGSLQESQDSFGAICRKLAAVQAERDEFAERLTSVEAGKESKDLEIDAELRRRNDLLERYEARLRDVTEQMSSQQASAARDASQIAQERDELAERLGATERELKRRVEECGELRRALELAEESLGAAQNELADAKTTTTHARAVVLVDAAVATETKAVAEAAVATEAKAVAEAGVATEAKAVAEAAVATEVVETQETSERQLTAALEEEKARLVHALSARDETIAKLAEEKARLSAAYGELEMSVAAASPASQGDDHVSQHLSAKVEFLERQLAESKAAQETTSAALRRATDELAQAKARAEQGSVISFEMADLELGMQNLQQQSDAQRTEIRRLTELLESKRGETDALCKEIETMKGQRQKQAEGEKKLRSAIVKLKKELADASQRTSNNAREAESASVKMQEVQQRAEEAKVELAAALSEREAVVARLEGQLDARERQMRGSEAARAKAETELESMSNELLSVKRDYESYKVRVHSVLRQQRKPGGQDEVDSTTSVLLQERDSALKAAELLQEKLQTESERLAALRDDHDRLESEHERLAQRNKELQLSSLNRETVVRLQLEKADADLDKAREQHLSIVRQLTQKNEQMRHDFEERIRKLQQESEAATGSLTERVRALEADLAAQAAQQMHAAAPVVAARQVAPVRPLSLCGDGEVPAVFPPGPVSTAMGLSMRQSFGSTDLDAGSITPDGKGSTAMGAAVPLEDLLNGSETASVTFPTASDVSEDPVVLQRMLDRAIKRIAHVSEVLTESEEANARLQEQAAILKEEIRRLERNAERNEHVANNEYLKNVMVKFLTLKGGEDRTRLLPVLTTMLRLNSEEQALLTAIAKGSDQAPSPNVPGWSNYLHRWTGMS